MRNFISVFIIIVIVILVINVNIDKNDNFSNKNVDVEKNGIVLHLSLRMRGMILVYLVFKQPQIQQFLLKWMKLKVNYN